MARSGRWDGVRLTMARATLNSKRSWSQAPPLTIEIVITWMRAFKEEHGVLPGPHEKRSVPGQPHEKWSNLDTLLLQGRRGLSPGNSLTRLAVSHFGSRNVNRPPRLTETMIVKAIRTFHEAHGRYPNKDEKEPVPGHPGEKWSHIEAALRAGGRGLPGGSSLAKVREEKFDGINRKNQTPLTEPLIVAWMAAFLKKYGILPTSKERREVPDQPKEAWSRIDGCLHEGCRGLKGGETLIQLGRRHFPKVEPPPKPLAPPKMTEETIVEWMRTFEAKYGVLPKSSEKREVPGHPDKNWTAINTALKQGLNDLPGDSSLAQLKVQHFGYQHHLSRPPLAEAAVVEWMQESYRLHGTHPTPNDRRAVPAQTDENWQALNIALRNGNRGLAGGSSLAELRELHFGVVKRKREQKWTPSQRPPLSAFPQLIAEWHSSRNNHLDPNTIPPGSAQKVWWQCPKGSDHEWEASLNSRTGSNAGCPMCSGLKPSVTNCIATVSPRAVEMWHPTKNLPYTPYTVVAGSRKRYWWMCPKSTDHEWQSSADMITRGGGCPACHGLLVFVTNSLSTLYPVIASEWHPTKNGALNANTVTAKSSRNIWWRCSTDPRHEWQAAVHNRTVNESGCPYCSRRNVSDVNALAVHFPELIKQWHPTNNGTLNPAQISLSSNKKVWWKCPNGPDHEWQGSPNSRTSSRLADGSPQGCPFCRGLRISVTNSIAVNFPDIAAELHPTRNGGVDASTVFRGSNEKYWWLCKEGHEWRTKVSYRTLGTGCPVCNGGWGVEAIRVFVRSLAVHLPSLTPSELWVIFQQSGVLDSTGKGRAFIKALATGRFPQQEIDRFLDSKPSAVDDFFGEAATLPKFEAAPDAEPADRVIPVDGRAEQEETQPNLDALPTLNVSAILGALNAAASYTSDSEAIAFLVASGKAKLWRRVFADEVAAISEARSFAGTEYAETVREDFLREYESARTLPIPEGYAFVQPGGTEITPPNLMQRLVASRLQRDRRMGNWSGMGAGKTNSAILASRVINAKVTVVTCPNNVVDGWATAIKGMFPDSSVICKTFEPDWGKHRKHLYLVLNYEMFQQRGAEDRVRALTEQRVIDFVVVDEIQFVKQRAERVEDVSKRRKMVNLLIALATGRNGDLGVLGMSGTPVVNNLREGIALVEMVTGVEHADLLTAATVANCMRLYQRLTTLGPRWLMQHKTGCERRTIEVDCSAFVDEIRALGRSGTPLKLEEILTRARLTTILENIVPKTLVYTHYVGGTERLDRQLYDAISNKGWRVGFFTGDEKSGLHGFLDGDVDVLIASSAIATGVDKLQHVCNRLLINVLPWTAAEFEQLIGRIHRQGQKRNVEVVIPITRAEVNGAEWSWCRAKMQRLQFKKSIADAAVDGIVPEGHLRSESQVYQDLTAWLERLAQGQVASHERRPLPILIGEVEPVEERLGRFGDFSRMNARWNQANSATTHERLEKEPTEWRHYHDELARVRSSWSVDPQEEFIRWARLRTDLVIGDFGCGRAKVRNSLADRHVVHSFDHVAVSEDVLACDMAHVPLENEVLDVALFCLSMMGCNGIDYLREAYRVLKLDGWLHVYEPTSRFLDTDGFVQGLRNLGFGNVDVRDDVGAFTLISARKTEHNPRADVTLGGLSGLSS
jgi:hypothetical protein